jgi:hypothetical protein
MTNPLVEYLRSRRPEGILFEDHIDYFCGNQFTRWIEDGGEFVTHGSGVTINDPVANFHSRLPGPHAIEFHHLSTYR